MIWKECKSLIVSDLERLTKINKWVIVQDADGVCAERECIK